MSGREFPVWAGKLHFFTTFIGVNVTFFPMHFLGISGMPRRYIDYPDAFAGWNEIISYGAYLTFLSTIFFLVVAVYALFAGKRVGANYWGIEDSAATLEWTVSSPPPMHSFDTLPKIR
jgi:cytochrome c oxidase subunit 1